MRRADREITDRTAILDVLQRATTIRVGIHDQPYPYVVPLNYGFEDTNGEIQLYIHGAREGKKHSLLAQNAHVCIEADIFHRYTETNTGLTCEYESIIGYGKAIEIEGKEAIQGLDLICTHCGYKDYKYDTKGLQFMRIYRITLSSVTGKRRFV